MPKKLHPADLADIEKIGRATAFNVHLRLGPDKKINRTAKTLAVAIRIADKLGQTPSGKRPMIYAITPDKMMVHVPAAVIAKARKEAATGARKARQASERPGKAAKRATAPHRAAGARQTGRRAEIAEKAAKGILPPVPDFSAETHRRFRGRLAEIVRLVEADEVAALKAIEIKTYSSSPKAIDRYRNLAVQALEARARV